jgi:hypothetical protein
MEIKIKRTYRPTSTTGDGFVLNEKGELVFEFHTLELPWKDNQHNISCIPEGEYMVLKMPPTAKRKYQYFWVQDVPDRSSILFHPGNYTHDILGCILPGESFADMDNDNIIDIINTTATLKILTALMPEKFKLTIEKSELYV